MLTHEQLNELYIKALNNPSTGYTDIIDKFGQLCYQAGRDYQRESDAKLFDRLQHAYWGDDAQELIRNNRGEP